MVISFFLFSRYSGESQRFYGEILRNTDGRRVCLLGLIGEICFLGWAPGVPPSRGVGGFPSAGNHLLRVMAVVSGMKTRFLFVLFFM